MKGQKDFKPYISADMVISEMSVTSIVLGIVLAVVFGAANAYLGLRVGMTVSASIPAAVISMGIIRIILKRESILENNLVQTIGSAGESVAAGAIFTIPALFLWSQEWGTTAPSLMEIFIIALLGGILGILFMVPLRKSFIVKEHESLPYPEGTACAEVLLAGEEGGSKAFTVFCGLGIASVYKFIADGLKIVHSEIHYELKSFRSAIGIDVLPALLGVGYICGTKIASYMFAGGILGWLVLLPLIGMFGGNAIIFPAKDAISTMDSWKIWSNYIKYIGAGAVAVGGIISLIRSFPMIVDTLRKAFKDFGHETSNNYIIRTEKDLSMKVIMIAVAIIALFIWWIPVVPISLWGAIVVVVVGFLFAAVSARLVGMVGSSNNPVSGMTIATLLVTSFLFKLTGQIGREGMIAIIAICSIICIITAIAGDTSQDLKTGYILGATPVKQQIGELLGAFFAAITIGGVLYLLNEAWGYGSAELPAPQATLMKLIVEGVMEGNLPWNLVFVGGMIAVFVEIIGIPVLPFAVGLYLPVHLSAGILMGSLIRLYFEKKANVSEKDKKEKIENGILYSSGLIAGEGLIGIILAILTIIPVHNGASNIGKILDISNTITLGSIGSLFALLILLILMFVFSNRKKE